MKKIVFIPIDNRPVCYTLPKQIAAVDEALTFLMPERNLLGGLFSDANTDEITKWFKNVETADAIIVSLDTIAYGGLIPSRRSVDTFEQIKIRLEQFKEILKSKRGKVYAFSSIMRISNNNVNEEEKEYWNLYGKKIFEYSFNFHKFGSVEHDIPQKILSDYLATRKRNFEINKMYLDWAEEGVFEKIIFSKDDCAEFGLNVKEAQELDDIIKKRNLPAVLKTGADEIPLSLFARAVSDFQDSSPKISVKFLAPDYKYLISNYEDISIEKCVRAQLELAGCKVVEEGSDALLLVNNFEEKQGEIVMERETKPFEGDFVLPETPFLVADVRFANGADNAFVEKFVAKVFDFDSFYGYSAWNTSANSLGSLICAFVVRFFAQEYSDDSFKRLQAVRFLDDWAYQANVRQEVKKRTSVEDVESLNLGMKPFESRVSNFLNLEFETKYSYPWNRFFEVEVDLK